MRWEGYNSSWDTWEPEDNIFDDELIQEFHGSLGQAPPGKVAKGMCGTFGCTLPDKHPGLHNVPDLGARKRRKPLQPDSPSAPQPAVCLPVPDGKQQKRGPGKPPKEPGPG